MSNIQELTADQLEQLLAKKRKEEAAEREAKRQAYETSRDDMVQAAVTLAERLSNDLATFKLDVFGRFQQLYILMMAYGDVRRDSRGSFTVKTTDGNLKVEVDHQRIFSFDERAIAAAQLVRDFLADKVKKKDQKTYDLIVDLLEKDKQGNFDPRKIQLLYKHEPRMQDDRFTQACDLFRESYTEDRTAQYIRFYRKDESGKYRPISLNFSSL